MFYASLLRNNLLNTYTVTALICDPDVGILMPDWRSWLPVKVPISLSPPSPFARSMNCAEPECIPFHHQQYRRAVCSTPFHRQKYGRSGSIPSQQRRSIPKCSLHLGIVRRCSCVKAGLADFLQQKMHKIILPLGNTVLLTQPVGMASKSTTTTNYV